MDPFVEQMAARTHARQVSLQQRAAQRVGLQGCDEIDRAPVPLKRQRDPLSENENLVSPAGNRDGLKRRCLDALGEENFNPLQLRIESPPKPHPRRAELEMKPDTPAISSVKSRLKQLVEKQEGDALILGMGVTPLAQKNLSGSERGNEHQTEFHLIGDSEFRSRVERFELGPPQDSSSLSTPQPCVLSGFTRTIQQKLQEAETPSTSRVQRIRQERKQELLQLKAQPIKDNAWLKRNCFDTTLAQEVPCAQAEDAESSENHDAQSVTEDRSEAAMSAFTMTLVSPKQPHPQTECPDTELGSPEELSTSKMIDEMFEGVLDTTEEEEEQPQRHEEKEGEGNSSTSESEEERREQQPQEEEEEKEHPQEGVKREEESKPQDVSEDELLSTLPSCLLSPLSKSVEAVVTPLRLATSVQREAPHVLTPEETTSPPAESAPLYSIDAYRTQRSSQRVIQCTTPAARSNGPERPRTHPPVNTKERIMMLNEEAGRLQSIINQTLQALSCCTDPGHGQGSLEEAEAERLLLLSSEKRSALLAEVARLREVGGCDPSSAGPAHAQNPCRGTVTVSNIKLPLKMDFVSSVRAQPGRPTHYFFVMIRYGAYDIVATPLATAADAIKGDTISFPTSITLQDIPSSFEIDVEVFSLSHCPRNNLDTVRRSTKSKVTPKKLLNTITRTNHSLTSSNPSTMGPRRSSKFSLVGCHRITLQSLGQSKFPLDKMKFEGKVRKLLGDEFQEKVPFLSPLEGNIYLQLDCEGHSNVQHHGFLTVFEDVSGFGAWHRRWFRLEDSWLHYWSYPGDERSKTPEGSLPLVGSSSLCVRPVTRDSCARPHTFEIACTQTLLQSDVHELEKRWFSADTREERVAWIEKLSQALLDLQTWTPHAVTPDSQPCTPSVSELPRESVL
ncbi:hypothetical protein AGOR_G00006820 [Albula goreensis]|uniref:PH domain-containing protein n=1 Tax=Albula goreensis TaxID=1534307 RepID=A0A8T3E615_9TELE|nr:hypothetical protein AGOR_G00006820 [Albula goreensis]